MIDSLVAGGAILATLIAMIAGSYFKGRASGKKVEQDKQKDEIIKQAEQAKAVQDETDSISDAAIFNELRERWIRK